MNKDPVKNAPPKYKEVQHQYMGVLLPFLSEFLQNRMLNLTLFGDDWNRRTKRNPKYPENMQMDAEALSGTI